MTSKIKNSRIENTALMSGIQLYNRKAYDEALGCLLAIEAKDDNEGMELAYYLGLCYTKLGKYDDALLYLEQVVTASSIEERVCQCRFLLAVIYVLSGRKRLADFELNKLLEAGYKTASVYAAIAYVAWEQNDTEKCILYYEKSLAEDPDNLTSLNGMGYVLACEKQDLAKALSFCKRAVDVSPKSAACLDSLGWVYFRLGLMKDAKMYLEQAAKCAKGNEVIAEHLRQVNSSGNYL